MTIKSDVLKGLKWTASTKAASQIISWITTIYVIRILAPGDYGLMAMASVVIVFLSTFNEFGLGAALVQSRDIDDKRTGAVYGAMLFLGVAFSIFLALCSYWIGLFFEEPRLPAIISVAGLQFIISAATLVPESLMRRAMDFKIIGIGDMVGAISASLTTFLFAISGYGVWSLVLGSLAGALIRAAIIVILCPQKARPNLHLNSARTLLSFGSLITGSRFIAYFMSQSDVLIGAKFLGKEALGIYTVSLHIATLPMEKAMSTLNQVAFSAVARMQDKKIAVSNGLLKAIRLLSLLILPVVVTLATLASELILLLLGSKWEGAIIPLQLASIVIPIRMLNGLLFTAVNGLGRADIGFKNTITGAIIMPICFLAGVQWGVIGLAAAWVLGTPVAFALNFRRTREITGLSGSNIFRAIKTAAIGSFIMAITVIISRSFFPAELLVWVKFPALIAISAATYITTCLLIDTELKKSVASASWLHINSSKTR